MPRAAVEICRQRLNPAHFHRATILAETFAPDGAIEAGFLDRVVRPEQVQEVVAAAATAMTQLDPSAHQATKLRARKAAISALAEAIEADSAAYLEAEQGAAARPA
jgi:enoyl-CoA hydratase